MKFFKIILIFVLILSNDNVKGQNLEVSHFHYTVNFEYQFKDKDTICKKSFLIKDGNDTINLIDEFGNKQKVWYEPYFSPIFLNCDSQTITIMNNSLFINLDSKTNEYNTIESDTQIQLMLNIFSTFESGNIRYYKDGACNDNVLYINTSHRVIQDGFYIEEYWFGFLFGKYSSGIRMGHWKFFPKSNKNRFINVIEFGFNNNFNQFKEREKRVLTKKIVGFEYGAYKNNQREGSWIGKQNFHEITTSELIYKNDKLKHFLVINDKNIKDTLFSIYTENNNIFLIGSKFGIINISYLPFTFRGFGERSFFYELNIDSNIKRLKRKKIR
ncbi:MAG: hypothetical protein Q8K70_10075 [Bacteroidota bacterium]|nr:hypothetical protein [Bacteroidota bacterium]